MYENHCFFMYFFIRLDKIAVFGQTKFEFLAP